MTVPLIKAYACLTVFNTRRTAECYTICKALTRKEIIKIVPCQILSIQNLSQRKDHKKIAVPVQLISNIESVTLSTCLRLQVLIASYIKHVFDSFQSF